MSVITLPDGQTREVPNGATCAQFAEAISVSLGKAALAAEVDGKLVDLCTPLNHDANVRIITSKDPESLEVIRHSTAHLLAQAVKQLYPKAQVTIGPVIENGFYYDFAYTAGFTPEDLEKITKRMHELVKQKNPVTRKVVSRNEAIAYFESIGEKYKAEIIKSIPENETLSLYTQGDFTDLCRGPHVPNTSFLKVFKLMSVAGAYWRGDSKNEMLQRIYGTAWRTEEELKQYIFMLEEAEKRDHRKLGKALDLFHLQEDAPGMIFWHPNGWIIWQIIEQHLRLEQSKIGFEEIKTPQVVDISLWQKSGHADKYLENMFLTHSENRDYALKPMSCPCHVQVYNQGIKSYRDLPVRLAEFGICHRNESSGSLHGLFRVRSMVQDDAHIFCTEQQIEAEVATFMNYAFKIYADFGLTQVRVKLATRPTNKIGDDRLWDKAEQALSDALIKQNITFEYLPGEGAFYGPKIELHLKDSLGREWQCGTMQVDFNMPMRLGAEYVAEDNTRKIPVMLHRATLGSLERFIGMLIEHYAGIFPVWLAPVQLVVMGITDKHQDYVNKVVQSLKEKGFRAKADLRNEKIGFKIREHSLQKIPYQLVVGDKEMVDNTIAVRNKKGEDLGAMDIEHFIKFLQTEVSKLGKME
jgi:threonyl-tRNA synthetase